MIAWSGLSDQHVLKLEEQRLGKFSTTPRKSSSPSASPGAWMHHRQDPDVVPPNSPRCGVLGTHWFLVSGFWAVSSGSVTNSRERGNNLEGRLGREQNGAWRDFRLRCIFHDSIIPSTPSTSPKPSRFGHSISEKNPANRNLSARRPANLAPCTVALKIGHVLSSHDPCQQRVWTPGQIRSMRNPLWPNVRLKPLLNPQGYPVVQPSQSPRAGAGAESHSSCAKLLNTSPGPLITTLTPHGPALGDPEIWRGERMERM
ncbi:hypothetical protein B0T21DRAFT_349143 [Apiosordaria backusii]|uniref:Uncharacterized protein n=1 Tax=Apiosordaria backusii TaxID=314023 RepID=A0AA40BK14_9PEZI|nr:hypothetical protein B0T21DRAFT_349143 [Apiosordaria backusii]